MRPNQAHPRGGAVSKSRANSRRRSTDECQGRGPEQWPRGSGTLQAQSGMSFGTWGPGEHLSRRSARSPDRAGLTARHAALRDGTRASPRPGRAGRGPKADTQENTKQTGTHGGNTSSGLRNRQPRWWASRGRCTGRGGPAISPRRQRTRSRSQKCGFRRSSEVQGSAPGLRLLGQPPRPSSQWGSRRAKVLPAGLISPGTQDSPGPASPPEGKAAQ